MENGDLDQGGGGPDTFEKWKLIYSLEKSDYGAVEWHPHCVGQSSGLFHGRMDLFCEDAVQRLWTSPHPCAADLLCQLHSFLHHVRVNYFWNSQFSGQEFKVKPI